MGITINTSQNVVLCCVVLWGAKATSNVGLKSETDRERVYGKTNPNVVHIYEAAPLYYIYERQ